MSATLKDVVISKLGDASAKLLVLADRAEQLAPMVAPNTPECDEFFDIIGQMNSYLAEYGFQLIITIILKGKESTLRLAIRDTAPTQIKQ